MASCAIFPVVALVAFAVPCECAVAGPLFAAQKFTAGNSPFSVTVADFNGDGALDLAVANSASGDVDLFVAAFNDDVVYVLWATGTGGFTAIPLACLRITSSASAGEITFRTVALSGDVQHVHTAVAQCSRHTDPHRQ